MPSTSLTELVEALPHPLQMTAAGKNNINKHVYHGIVVLPGGEEQVEVKLYEQSSTLASEPEQRRSPTRTPVAVVPNEPAAAVRTAS